MSACSGAIVLPLATVSAAKENVYIVGTASKPSQCLRRGETEVRIMQMAKWAARIGAVFYVLWGVFHLVAANAVYALAEQPAGMVGVNLAGVGDWAIGSTMWRSAHTYPGLGWRGLRRTQAPVRSFSRGRR